MQQSLEKKFGKAGGTIPITPSEGFERRMGVSKATDLDLYVFYLITFVLKLLSVIISNTRTLGKTIGSSPFYEGTQTSPEINSTQVCDESLHSQTCGLLSNLQL